MVMGQGSAGCFFSYFAKRAGAATVIASDKAEARLAAAPGFGTDVAVRAERDNVRAAVMDHTGGAGADVVIEAVGSSEALVQSVELVRVGGEMLFFGLPESHEPVPFNYHAFFRKKVRSVCHYGAQHEPDLVSFQHALDLIAGGQIDVSRMVSHRLSIEHIADAMAIAHERTDNALKVAIDLS